VMFVVVRGVGTSGPGALASWGLTEVLREEEK